MADDQQNMPGDEDLGMQESSTQETPQKKGPLLSPLIVRILLFFALVILIVLISTVVVMVFGKVAQPQAAKSYPDEWSEDIKRPKAIHLAYLPLDDPFRQQLLDQRLIQIKIILGYKAEDKILGQELSAIKPEIRDIVIKHLSTLKSDYFSDQSGTSLERLEEDLLKQINRILNSGKVDRILFQDYNLM
jgi:flagellar basal body-associated protein FliL